MSSPNPPFPHLEQGDVYVRYDAPWDRLPHVIVNLDNPYSSGGRYATVPAKPYDETVNFERSDDPPNPAEVFVHRRTDASAERTRALVRLHASKLIVDSKTKLSPGKLVSALAKVIELDARTTEGWVRLEAAYGTLEVKTTPSTGALYMALSERVREAENARAYAAGFAHELVVQARDIGYLIQHPGTKGSYREELLRNLIQKHIPSRFHAATGFIHGQKEQLDILIYDQIDYAPLFRQGDLVVVPQAAVRAVIEVKSKLTRPELRSALKHLSDAVPSTADGPPIFQGVFAFRGTGTDGLLAGLKEFYGEPDEEGTLDDALNMTDFYSPVHAVCVLQRSLAMVEFEERETAGGRVVPIAFAPINLLGRDAQAALFFDRLCRFLRSPFEDGLRDATRAKLVMEEALYGEETEIRNDAWGPYAAEDLYPQGVDDLRKAKASFKRWIGGGAWAP